MTAERQPDAVRATEGGMQAEAVARAKWVCWVDGDHRLQGKGGEQTLWMQSGAGQLLEVPA